MIFVYPLAILLRKPAIKPVHFSGSTKSLNGDGSFGHEYHRTCIHSLSSCCVRGISICILAGIMEQFSSRNTAYGIHV